MQDQPGTAAKLLQDFLHMIEVQVRRYVSSIPDLNEAADTDSESSADLV